MKTQSMDTSPDAERVLIGMIRKAPITKRFAFVQNWTASLLKAKYAFVRNHNPQASNKEIKLLFLESQYGKDLLNAVRPILDTDGIQMADHANYLQVVYSLASIFEQLDIPYALSGSLASSLYGMQRATLQLDIIADIQSIHCEALFEKLAPISYFRAEELKTAIEQRTPFTIIYLQSLLKIVVTLPQKLPQGQEVFHLVRGIPLVEGGKPVGVLAPEQIILLLLDAFKQSNRQADDLWYDLLGIMKVQSTDLDIPFLISRATALDLVQLAEQALDDAGI